MEIRQTGSAANEGFMLCSDHLRARFVAWNSERPVDRLSVSVGNDNLSGTTDLVSVDQ